MTESMAAKVVSTTTFQGNVANHTALQWSPDNKISLTTDAGVHILEPQFTPYDITGTISYQRLFIPCPTTSQQFDVGIARESLHKELNREQLYFLMLDRTLSPSIASQQNYKSFRLAKWSPRGVVSYDRCLLATVTQDHRLCLHMPSGNSWITLLELSEKFYNYLKDRNFVDCRQASEDKLFGVDLQFYNLKQRLYILAVKDMLWTHVFHKDSANKASQQGIKKMREAIPKYQFVLLITAMKSGHIVLWKIAIPCLQKDDVSIFSIWDTQQHCITALSWQKINSSTGLLAVGNLSGNVKIYMLLLPTDFGNPGAASVIAINSCTVWADPDKLAVSQLGFKKVDDGSYLLIASKEKYLIGCELKIGPQSISVQHVAYTMGQNSLFLTGLCSTSEGFVVTSEDGCLMNVNIQKMESGLSISSQKIETGSETSKLTFKGIAVSNSETFIAYVDRISCMFDHLVIKEPMTLNILSMKNMADTLKDLLENPASCLLDVMDKLIFIQILIIASEVIPKEILEIINSSSDIKQDTNFILKIKRWFLKFFLVYKHPTFDNIDELKTKLKTVETEIMRRHLKSVIQKIDIESLDNWSPADISTLSVISDWLFHQDDVQSVEQISMKLHDLTPEDTSCQEKCKICQSLVPLEDATFSICPNKHKFGRCCLTLAICSEVPYLQCRSCLSLAKITDWNIGDRCTYCDGELR